MSKSGTSELIRVGRYATEQDAIRDGLRLLRAREIALAELDLERAVEASKAGRVRPAEDVLRELEALVRSRRPA